MYLNEFKHWLKGFLAGKGVESRDDLEKEDLLEILSKFEEVQPYYKTTTDAYVWPASWPTVYGSKNVTTNKISSMIDELLGK